MNEQTPSQATLLEKETKSIPDILPKPRLVIIHDTDADGLCAAWCINKGFKDDYEDTLIIPQRAGENTIPEGLTENDSVFLVDRTYPWETLLALSKVVFSITVIDHHKSAMNAYQKILCGGLYEFENVCSTESSLLASYGNINIVMDIKHAACMLAYQYVMEHGVDPDTTVEVPFFVKYIEDRDMWWFKLPDSKKINAGMYIEGHTFENYDAYYYNPTLYAFKHQLTAVGAVSIATTAKIVKGIACGPTVGNCLIRLPVDHPLAQTDNCELHEAIVVCCPFSLISDLGDYMLRSDDPDYLATRPDGIRPKIVICYNRVFTLGKPNFTYSIRSTIDMLWLAKIHEGGGHPNACGFSTDLSPIDAIYYKK